MEIIPDFRKFGNYRENYNAEYLKILSNHTILLYSSLDFFYSALGCFLRGEGGE